MNDVSNQQHCNGFFYYLSIFPPLNIRWSRNGMTIVISMQLYTVTHLALKQIQLALMEGFLDSWGEATAWPDVMIDVWVSSV